MTSTLHERVDETAFAMLDLSPEQRDQCFCEAFEHSLALHPEVEEVPPLVIEFIGAVYQRIAELERQPSGSA